MKLLKQLCAYIGLFFLLGAPALTGLALAIITGETANTVNLGVAHSIGTKHLLSPYVIYSSIAEVPWLMITIYAVMRRFMPESQTVAAIKSEHGLSHKSKPTEALQ